MLTKMQRVMMYFGLLSFFSYGTTNVIFRPESLTVTKGYRLFITS